MRLGYHKLVSLVLPLQIEVICNYFNQMSSHVTNPLALYFTSALDLGTTFCFLPFEDIKLPPQVQNIQKLIAYPWVSLPDQILSNQLFEYVLYLHK